MTVDKLSFDANVNCADLKISKEIYLRILGKAIVQTESDIESLRAALEKRDYDTIQTISHRLKGDYDNLRVTQLAQIARMMNNMMKAGEKDEARLKVLWEDIGACFSELKAQVVKTSHN